MSAEKGSSKADTLVKVVLVFFISLLSFSVGTLVGKQVSDSDHRRLALEGEYSADRSIASAEAEPEAADKITDQEVESLTEEFVNKEKASQATATADAHSASEEHTAAAEDSVEADAYKSYSRGKEAAPAPTPTPAKAPAAATAKADVKSESPTKKGAVSAAATKLAHDKAPSDGAKEVRKPASALPSVASSAIGKFTVQVASYAEEGQAKEHAAGLKGKGWNAFYLPAVVSGRTWYRVLVGLFSNDKSAKDFRAQFMKETKTKSAIVQKIVQ